MTLLTTQFATAGATIEREPFVSVGSAEAQLVRNNNGLSVSGHAMGLTPGNTYTVWWIVIGATDFVVVNASGGIANTAGDLRFGGALPTGTYQAGDTSPRYVEVAGTLSDPLLSMVILHVVDHGPAIPGLIPIQISHLSAESCPIGCELSTEIIFFAP
jgi:hypothetical protein